MKYVLLIAAFNALFFAILLLQKKPKSLHDKILFFWLLYLGLFTTTYAFSSHDLFSRNPLLSSGLISLFMLHGPFLYLYIEALSSKKSSLSKCDYFHLIPFLSFIGYLFISSRFPEYSERIRLDHVAQTIEPPIPFVLFLVFVALSGPVYFILSIRLFRKLDKNIFNNFSYLESVDLSWLRKLVYIFGIIWSALIVVATIHHVFHMFSIVFCTDGLFLSLSVFIILIGYFGLKQKKIFISFPDETTEYITESKTKYAGMLLKEVDAEQYVNRIKQYMLVEKPYLDADLTLPKLATKLQIPSYQLSRLINEKFELNFFDFINQYRIEEVKAKIANPEFDNLSLLGIAFECGFNTKSAFNRVFKKMTGLTPSDYKKQL